MCLSVICKVLENMAVVLLRIVVCKVLKNVLAILFVFNVCTLLSC